MKTKLSLIDVLAEVAELRRRLTGMRCVNIYDVDGDKCVPLFNMYPYALMNDPVGHF